MELSLEATKWADPLAQAFDIAVPQGHIAAFQVTRGDQKHLIMPTTHFGIAGEELTETCEGQ